MTDEVTRRQQERKDTALQYKRYLVECMDMTIFIILPDHPI